MSTNSGSRRTVLVTGGSSGFGAVMARAFSRAYFDLILCGRDEKRLARVRDEITAREIGRCEIVQADLSTTEGVESLSAFLRSCPIDTVVNNAAINPELVKHETASSLVDIGKIIATNTSAAIAVCGVAFDHFQSRGKGAIVNVNSIAGLRGSSHEPIYAASKFGLRGFSESVKEAWLAKGVRMTDVYVGAIATGMSAARPDVAQLIDPDELASFLVDLCQSSTFFVRDINIQKTPLVARRIEKVVFANGVFDLLHPGHMALLRFAKSIGSKLIVGINSDRSVRLLKGPQRPVHDEQMRKSALEMLHFVDEVVIFDNIRTTEIVGKISPDIVVKGDEYSIDSIRETDNIPSTVEIVTFPVVRNSEGSKLSTTALIEKSRKD